MADYQTIMYDVSDGIATLTLNRPDRLNAFTDEMIHEVETALNACAEDDAVRVVIITGAGRAFCAGQDLNSMSDPTEENALYNHLMEHYRPMMERIITLEKPVIAAINGAAAGAGASLAMACDLKVMANTAYLLQAFNNIGLVPDTGSTWLLVRQVGYSRAFEITIEAEKIPAGRCANLGLVNRIVEPDDLMAETRAWAEKLADRPRSAGLTKRALHKAMVSSYLDAFEFEARMQQLAAESDDFAEGVAAFKEKRKPNFTGK